MLIILKHNTMRNVCTNNSNFCDLLKENNSFSKSKVINIQVHYFDNFCCKINLSINSLVSTHAKNVGFWETNIKLITNNIKIDFMFSHFIPISGLIIFNDSQNLKR
jgi:hypothetical protein